jgi:ATP-dependent RNA helicase UAP56/SUB2
MLSATLSEQRMKDCARYMVNPTKVAIDEGKLVLTGLTQYYVRLPEDRKFDKLVLLLDALAFNQVIIFTNRVDRAKKLVELLKLKLFNPICIHSSLKQEERIRIYDLFKANGSRLLIATDLFGRGVDI